MRSYDFPLDWSYKTRFIRENPFRRFFAARGVRDVSEASHQRLQASAADMCDSATAIHVKYSNAGLLVYWLFLIVILLFSVLDRSIKITRATN